MSDLWTALDSLATCLCQQLTDCGNPTCFCGILPGAQIAADYAQGDCGGPNGMAWVRLDNSYMSAIVGVQSIDINNCGLMLGADVEMGVLRPLIGLDSAGDVPSAEDMLAAAMVQVQDQEAMRRALMCCDIDALIVGQYTPAGPQGGLVGGTWAASFQVP